MNAENCVANSFPADTNVNSCLYSYANFEVCSRYIMRVWVHISCLTFVCWMIQNV